MMMCFVCIGGDPFGIRHSRGTSTVPDSGGHLKVSPFMEVILLPPHLPSTACTDNMASGELYLILTPPPPYT